MKTIENESIITLIINKSTFISHLARVDEVNEAKDYIKKIKLQYPDATHHVTAYLIGLGGEFGHYQDDGEPSGTAGFPAFEVLRKNNLTNIVCVIVRYFGGVKLGAGGLVRAYSKSVSENLKQTKIVPIVVMTELTCSFDYCFYPKIEPILNNYQVLDRLFGSNIVIKLSLPLSEKEKLIEELISITQGLVNIL